MGRPRDSEKRARDQEAFLVAFARTGIVKTAAQECGFKPVQHYRWLSDDTSYAERFNTVEVPERHIVAANRKPHGGGYRIREDSPRALKRKRLQEGVLEALAKSGIVMEAAAEAGTYPAQFYTWCRKYPEFQERAEKILRDTEDLRRNLVAAKIGAASRAAWDSPGRRQAWGEYQKHEMWTAEMREAAAARTRERLADPEFKAHWLEKAKAARPAACDNPSYFDVIDTPDKAYWLGFIATDGCVTGFSSGSLRLQVKLARRDRDHLVLLHKALKAKRPIRDREEWSQPPGTTERKARPCSVLTVSSHQIVHALVSHGITPRKTNDLKPWEGPADLVPHYWRGVIDGDGTITISPEGIRVGLAGSKAVVESFLAWARGVCGTTARAHQGKSGNRNYWVTYTGGTTGPRRLLAALYDDAPVALARKKALADLAVHGKPLAATLF